MCFLEFLFFCENEFELFVFQGVNLVWESYKLDPYVQKFSETVTCFQEKVEELLNLEEQINIQLKSLDTCQYSAPTFEQILNAIQKAVDSLSLHQYSNLMLWVQQLDEEVSLHLKKCCFYFWNGPKFFFVWNGPKNFFFVLED